MPGKGIGAGILTISGGGGRADGDGGDGDMGKRAVCQRALFTTKQNLLRFLDQLVLSLHYLSAYY